MKNWTTQAEQRLTEYLRQRATREGLAGDDAAELQDDLRRHIHEEAEQSDSATIGLMNLEQLLGRLDAGYQPATEPPPQPLPAKSRRGGFRDWTFGIILPLGVLLLEVLTSFCGSVFFNPVPTWWHAAWIAMVPLANFLLIRNIGSDRNRGMAAGFGLVTAAIFGLLFLPIIHLSILGLIFFGMGMLSLTPILAAIFSWRIGRGARRASPQPQRFTQGWRIGAIAAVLVFAALEGPALWTRSNLNTAAAGGKESEAAINRLRSFHVERSLLKACYEGRGMGGATDISGWMLNMAKHPNATIFGGRAWRSPGTNAMRDVFFRVTGKPFNSLKPPGNSRGNSLAGRGAAMDEFEFDAHVGGDQVAVRLKSLDLAESRFDGHLDSVSRLGYGEWTMVFKNHSFDAKEARCQVKLPRDGRVSRLTLWVNGEPREAAFSTVAKVKAAYKAVAVVQRRDPVLVNVVGPDTVMVQCFPVPARGEMKIRFGVTAPLADGRWEIPRIVERNFGIAESLKHALWLQGDAKFDLTGAEKDLTAAPDGPGHSLNAELDSDRLLRPGTAARLTALPHGEPPVVWCEDRFAKPEERYLVREPITRDVPAAKRLVVVIDGSASLADAKDWIVNGLAAQSPEKLQLILADDHARMVTTEELKRCDFTGGRDNEPALREAIRLARESGDPVVWVHGPQAVKLSQAEALLQSLERGTVHPVIYDVEAVTGPNRLAEAIHRTGCLQRGPALANPASDFSAFLQDLLAGRREMAWNWKRAIVEDGLEGKKVWDQLARTWAATTVSNPTGTLDDAARSELAARYQLVTAVSGAVVLETQQQYKDHGLAPVDPNAAPSIPGVPEPSTGALVMLATTVALLRRRREPHR